LRDRRPRQGRGHCWSHLDAHHRMMLLPRRSCADMCAPQSKSVRTQTRWAARGCKKTRSQSRVERSAILRATGEQRVNAAP
jgi:hypothetical protein